MFFNYSTTKSGFQTFPIGVAKYVTWPTTPWYTKFTCTHHLWTIPLIFYSCKESIHWFSFPLSICIVVNHVLLSRWLTPFYLKKEPNEMKYLNINLSHELWKDITFSFLQIGYDNPSTSMYLFRLLWRWQLLNFLVFLFVLFPISQIT